MDWMLFGLIAAGSLAVIGIGGWVKTAKNKMKGKTLPPA